MIMKLSEYFMVDEKAERILDQKRTDYSKYCVKQYNCVECKYRGSNNCFLDYIEDNDVEL